MAEWIGFAMRNAVLYIVYYIIRMSRVQWVLNLAIFFGQLYTKLATVATESGFQKRFASFNILIAEMLKTFDQNIFSSLLCFVEYLHVNSRDAVRFSNPGGQSEMWWA